MRILPLLALPGLCASSLLASPKPASIFGNHAVLQRDKPVSIWGTSAPGEKIRVRYGGVSGEGVADASGRWGVTLPPLPVGPPQDLIFEGSETVTSHDVLVGDVWLCSGQSNMVWTLGQSMKRDVGAEEIVAAPENAKIRQFVRKPGTPVFTTSPQTEIEGEWLKASPQTRERFSAVAYLFAYDLHERLKVPQGMIVSASSGTVIESWMSDTALQASGFKDEVDAKWKQSLADFPARNVLYQEAFQKWAKARNEAKEAGEAFTERAPTAPPGPGHHNTPTGCFNTLLHPFIPYTVRGIIWYQGEQSIGRKEKYAELLRSFLADLRGRWDEPTLPIFIVQLPNYASNGADRPEWAILREAQASLAHEAHNFTIVTIDLGLAEDVHPPDKRELARRLSLVAAKHVFNLPVHDRGPLLEKLERIPEGLRLRFASDALPLTLKLPASSGKTFEIAGEDGVFHPVTIQPEGVDSIRLTAPQVAAPVAVRYLWANAPEAILYDSQNLPAPPFQSKVPEPSSDKAPGAK